MTADPYTLYLLWDGDQLLYVGLDPQWPTQLHRHAAHDPWWDQVDDLETHPYPDLMTVRRAECTLIDQLHPTFNEPYGTARRLALDPGNRWLRRVAVKEWEKEQHSRPATRRRRRTPSAKAAALENTRLPVTARLIQVWLSSWEGPLPDTTEAAEALGISRTAAREAYADLLTVGYLTNTTGEVTR